MLVTQDPEQTLDRAIANPRDGEVYCTDRLRLAMMRPTLSASRRWCAVTESEVLDAARSISPRGAYTPNLTYYTIMRAVT